MANTAQDEIYRSFLEVAQKQPAEIAAAGQSLADLILQADQVRQDLAQQNAGAASSKARSSTSSASSGGGSSAQGQSSDGDRVLSEVLGVFKNGLGLSPLVKG